MYNEKFTIENIYYICKKNKLYEFYLNNYLDKSSASSLTLRYLILKRDSEFLLNLLRKFYLNFHFHLKLSIILLLN